MKLFRWILTLALCAAAVWALFSYKDSLKQAEIAQAQAMPEPAATVEAIKARQISFQRQAQATGEVQAYRRQTLSNELPGKIVAIHFDSGDAVEAGQVLVEFNHSEETAKLTAAQARRELAKKTLTRYTELRKENRISIEAFDQATADLQIARSDVAALQSVIDKKKLRSPFAARTGIHNLAVGQFLDTNTEITTLIGIHDKTWIDFSLPQTVPELALGSEVTILTDHSGAGSTGTQSAKVIAQNPMLFAESRNLRYRAEISRNQLPLKPNTLVTVEVPVAQPQTLISIPDLAITRDQFGDYVYVLTPGEAGSYRAKRQKVVLGDRRADQVMVLSGLEPNTLIAAKGAFKLRDGIKVYVADANAS